LTTTFRRGSDFRAYVQDSLAARGKPGERGPSAPDSLRARIGGAAGAALRESFSAAAAGLSSLVAAANAVLRRQAASPTTDEDEPPPPEALRSRRAQARPSQQSSQAAAPSRKLNLEQSRREIEAVQARLDARPGETVAPRNSRERWAAELAREYRREFHPLEAASEPAPAAVEDNPTAADGAAAAFFVAGKAAWRVGLFLKPAARFISAHSAPILKVAAVGLAIVGAAGFLAQWPRSGERDEAALDAPAQATTAAPRPAWVEIQKPFRLFDLAAPQLAHEKRLYTARRHNTGGGREDVLTYGEFAGTDPFLRVSVYRHGSEKSADAAYFVDMARRAAQLGLSLGRANTAETQATRFGDIETAALTLTEGRVARDNCRGFRFSAAQLGLTLAGFACGAGQEAVSGGDLACLLDRLDLVSAGEDRALRDFFAAAQARGARGCVESGSSPTKKQSKGLQ